MSKVDVSKCEFYKDNYCDCYKDIYGDWYHKCTDYELNNCYYKQLQQLKQENEELKEQYKLAEPLFQACKIKDLKINKYKQCLDEIEEYLNQYEMLGKLNIKYLLQLIKQIKGCEE